MNYKKFAIKQGFVNNVPPFIIGHKENLRIISWEENNKKKSLCDITLDELCSNIFRS